MIDGLWLHVHGTLPLGPLSTARIHSDMMKDREGITCMDVIKDTLPGKDHIFLTDWHKLESIIFLFPQVGYVIVPGRIFLLFFSRLGGGRCNFQLRDLWLFFQDFERHTCILRRCMMPITLHSKTGNETCSGAKRCHS